MSARLRDGAVAVLRDLPEKSLTREYKRQLEFLGGPQLPSNSRDATGMTAFDGRRFFAKCDSVVKFHSVTAELVQRHSLLFDS